MPYLSLALAACAGEGTAPPQVSSLELQLSGRVRALDSLSEGTYEGWVIGTDGTIESAGRFSLPPDGRVTLGSPIAEPEFFMLTIEPPGDSDSQPSLHKLLGGPFDGATATLSVERYVTATLPLEPNPGTHVLATLSDNEGGNSTNEESGVWLFDARGDTLDNSFYLDFTPLTEGWVYEGWIVRNHGMANELWISYGKFKPDALRQSNSRDDTGLGPFSGLADYDRAFPFTIRVPGDDWLANPLGISMPGALSLPLDLNGDAASGVPSPWTHVITIEPWSANREAELPAESTPFFLEPYRNAIGDGPPQQPRMIAFHPDRLPIGLAAIIPD
jgi:hypothetical protein